MNDKLIIYLKALTDPMRINIIKILSCGELCACEILEGLSITQTTLSHHMKILTKSGLVTKRKQGTFMYYTINEKEFAIVSDLINKLITAKKSCLCKSVKTSKTILTKGTNKCQTN